MASHADSYSALDNEEHERCSSRLTINDDGTSLDGDNQSDEENGHQGPRRDPPTAREESWSLRQFMSNNQLEDNRHEAIIERLSLLDLDPSPPNSMPKSRSARTKPTQERTRTPSPASSDSTPTPSVFSRSDSYSSTASSVSRPVPTHTTISLGGILPAHSLPVILEIQLPDELAPWPCFFKDILQTDCDLEGLTAEEWYHHMISHFAEFGPPGRALCIFCNRDFRDEDDPVRCWTDYLGHIRYHLYCGNTIENMRPDFVTWAYFRDIGILSALRYDEICGAATERQAAKFPWLEARDWESDERKAERVLQEKRRDREQNQVVIKERPCRRQRNGNPSARRSSTRGHHS